MPRPITRTNPTRALNVVIDEDLFKGLDGIVQEQAISKRVLVEASIELLLEMKDKDLNT